MTAGDLLDLWETAQASSPPARLRLLLQAALPDEADAAREARSIAAGDFALLGLRRRLFGASLAAHLDCPHCNEALEFQIDTDRFTPPAEPDAPLLAAGLRFRLPAMADIAAAALASGDSAAIRLLAQRCCLDAGGAEIPDAIVAEWDAVLAASERAAAIRVRAACIACGAAFDEMLDVAGFFWAELDDHANRLLDDVHVLAARYGWPQSDILAMSTPRRAAYLERCGA